MSPLRSLNGELRRACVAALTIGSVMTAVTAATAQAQLPDPFLLPRGALRVGFNPRWMSYDHVFDVTGMQIPLGAYFSADSLGNGLLPTLESAREAVRALTGDSAFSFNAGNLRTRIESDARRFPFSLSLGLSRRLTVTATVPIVVTRVKSVATLDTTGSEVGWNPASALAPVGAGDSLTVVLDDLEAAAMSLDAGIAGGSYGCPSASTCQDAQSLADRLRATAADLRTLTGYGASGSDGNPLPPFAPLAQSAAGQAIAQRIASLNEDLQALGEPGFTTAVPLPTVPVPPDAIDSILVTDAFGYGTTPLNPPETVKLAGLGDIELGARFGLATGPVFRAVLGTLVRLPTGKKQDDPNNLIDVAPADGQLDLRVSLDGALEPPGALGIWFAGAYTIQFGDQITRRIARVDQPIVPATAVAVVNRNLGDVLTASLSPALRLTPNFRALVTASLYHKGADRYRMGGADVPELDALTAQTIWRFGAGLWYRMDENRRGAALPIEAGFVYDRAFFGRGGIAPKGGRVMLSLRFFYNLWGTTPTPPPAPEEPGQPQGG